MIPSGGELGWGLVVFVHPEKDACIGSRRLGSLTYACVNISHRVGKRLTPFQTHDPLFLGQLAIGASQRRSRSLICSKKGGCIVNLLRSAFSVVGVLVLLSFPARVSGSPSCETLARAGVLDAESTSTWIQLLEGYLLRVRHAPGSTSESVQKDAEEIGLPINRISSTAGGRWDRNTFELIQSSTPEDLLQFLELSARSPATPQTPIVDISSSREKCLREGGLLGWVSFGVGGLGSQNAVLHLGGEAVGSSMRLQSVRLRYENGVECRVLGTRVLAQTIDLHRGHSTRLECWRRTHAKGFGVISVAPSNSATKLKPTYVLMPPVEGCIAVPTGEQTIFVDGTQPRTTVLGPYCQRASINLKAEAETMRAKPAGFANSRIEIFKSAAPTGAALCSGFTSLQDTQQVLMSTTGCPTVSILPFEPLAFTIKTTRNNADTNTARWTYTVRAESPEVSSSQVPTPNNPKPKPKCKLVNLGRLFGTRRLLCI